MEVVTISFLTGKQTTVTSMPGDITGLRQGLINYLSGSGFDTAITGLPKGGDLTPFQQLFQRSLNPVLAQAKESAGNLTGSGLSNVLGAAAGRSTSDFLLNLLNQRAQRFSSLLSGLALTGVSAQPAYKPGFLDYLFSAVGKAAPLFNFGGGSSGAPASASAGASTFGVDSGAGGGGQNT